MTQREVAAPAAEPIRVLWIIKTIGLGGAERLLAHNATYIDHSAFEVSLAYQWPKWRSLEPHFIKHGIYPICLSRGTRDWLWPARLWRLIRTGDFEIVHAHSPSLAAVSRIAVRSMGRSRRPIHMTTEHNLRGSYRFLSRLANKLTSNFDDHCIAVSTEVFESIADKSKPRASVQYQGIDVSALSSGSDLPARAASDRPFRILCVANLRAQKNYPMLFEACCRLQERGVEFRLSVVGDGRASEAEAIRELPRKLGIEDRVEFLGFRDDIASLMSVHDVLAIASDYEAGPLVAMEAAASGLPIVSTAVGLVRELFVDDEDCLITEPGQPHLFSEALRRMAVDSHLRRKLSATAKQRSTQFDIQQVTENLEQLYIDVLRPDYWRQ